MSVHQVRTMRSLSTIFDAKPGMAHVMMQKLKQSLWVMKSSENNTMKNADDLLRMMMMKPLENSEE